MATGGKLTDLTSTAAVREAMAQFRALGRDAFIEAYSTPDKKYLKSRDYFVVDDGVSYDSKPLAAASYGFEHGRRNALHSNDFSGGDPIIAKFTALGFKVVHWTSPRFEDGAVYTRKALRALFDVTDATIDTGMFRPSGTNSIRLFVTKDKTKDRTQYVNAFESDLLHWQGQTKGRKDAWIIAHKVAGDELLVFYRESKRQFSGAGFRYEGRSIVLRSMSSALVVRSAIYRGLSMRATFQTSAHLSPRLSGGWYHPIVVGSVARAIKLPSVPPIRRRRAKSQT